MRGKYGREDLEGMRNAILTVSDKSDIKIRLEVVEEEPGSRPDKWSSWYRGVRMANVATVVMGAGEGNERKRNGSP